MSDTPTAHFTIEITLHGFRLDITDGEGAAEGTYEARVGPYSGTGHTRAEAIRHLGYSIPLKYRRVICLVLEVANEFAEDEEPLPSMPSTEDMSGFPGQVECAALGLPEQARHHLLGYRDHQAYPHETIIQDTSTN